MRAKKGFTLVEILIVVVILGILAAIVIPQFTDASTQAKESSLASSLQTIRSQIELYKIQHNDNLPGEDSSSDFVNAMTTSTDQDGSSGSKYGPYLQQMPVNPFNDLSSVRTVTSNPNTGGNSDGWWFNTNSGDFGPDDTADPNHVDM